MSVKIIVEKAQFVMEELIRVQDKLNRDKKPPEDFGLMDFVATIPNPFNGHTYTCGEKAYNALFEILDEFHKNKEEYSNIDPRSLIDEFKKEYSEKFIKDGLEIKDINLQRVLSRMFNKKKRSLTPCTYYFPCRLYNPSDSLPITIGPVVLTPTKAFIDQHKEDFARSVEYNAERRIEKAKELKYKEELSKENALKYSNEDCEETMSLYDKNHWIASSDVAPCTKKIGQKIARENLESSIDTLKLIFSADFTSPFEVGLPPLLSSTPILSRENGCFIIGWSREYSERTQPDGLHEALSKEYPKRVIAQTSSLLKTKAELDSLDDISLRYLHCLRHFGESRNERGREFRVLRLVMAIEGLLLPVNKSKKEVEDQGITSAFVQRGLLFVSEEKSLESENNLRYAYDARSSVAHGNNDAPEKVKKVNIHKLEFSVRNVLSHILDMINQPDDVKRPLTLDELEKYWEARSQSKQSK